MTGLSRPVRRRVMLPRGPVAVTLWRSTLHPGGLIGFRAHRSRIEYVLPLARVFVLAADAYQQQRRAERKAAARARRNSR